MSNRVLPDKRDIINKIYEAKKEKIKVYPSYVPRASEIGHPCERYLVYSITRWQDRIPHDPGLEFVFEGGRLVENLAIKDFEEAGYNVYRPEPDKAIAESRPRITGHIDIRVDFGDGNVYTGEIKGLNKYDYDSLNSLEDFFNSKKVHIRKYPAQLMTYMYIKGENVGFFYLKSIPGFQPKFIWINLDYNYMEEVLKKTERIEKYVKDGTVPGCIDDYKVCERCPFLHVCLPEIKLQPMEIIDSIEMEEKLNRLFELKPVFKEYNEIDKEIKEAIKEKERLMIGDYLITGKYIDRKGYEVKPSKYWQSKIAKL